MKSNRSTKDDLKQRLTVTLAPGQRVKLEALAEANNTTLAFIVRYALTEFVERHQSTQLELKFPPGSEED